MYTAIQEAELCSIINELIKTYFRNTTDLVDFIEKFNRDYMKDFQEGTDDYIAGAQTGRHVPCDGQAPPITPSLPSTGRPVDAYAIDYCSALLAEQVGVALNPLEAYFKLSLLKALGSKIPLRVEWAFRMRLSTSSGFCADTQPSH